MEGISFVTVDLDTMSFTKEWPVKNALTGDSRFNRTYAKLTMEQLLKLYENTVGLPTTSTDYNAMLQACRRLGQIFIGVNLNTPVTSVHPVDTLKPSRFPHRKEDPMSKDTKPATEPKAPKTPKAEKPPKAPKPEADKRNGVTRPSAGTVTGSIWEAADKLSAKLKRPPTKGEVAEVLGTEINASTVATQYGKWRRYYGLVRENRKQLEAEEAAAAAEKAPAAVADDGEADDEDEGEEEGE